MNSIVNITKSGGLFKRERGLHFDLSRNLHLVILRFWNWKIRFLWAVEIANRMRHIPDLIQWPILSVELEVPTIGPHIRVLFVIDTVMPLSNAWNEFFMHTFGSSWLTTMPRLGASWKPNQSGIMDIYFISSQQSIDWTQSSHAWLNFCLCLSLYSMV